MPANFFAIRLGRRAFGAAFLGIALAGCGTGVTGSAHRAAKDPTETTSLTSNTAPGSATMPPASNQESSNATTNPDDDKAMIESEFWELIGTLPGRVDDLSAEQLTGRLASEGPARIINFADILAEKLYAIDHPVGAEQLIRDPTAGPSPMTMGDDLFLYARCAVVAAGKSSWERILNNPAGMAGTWYAFDGEFLLLVAPDAWERVTDTAYTHESPVSYETGSNTDNW